MMKTFRGMIQEDGIEQIRLRTLTGNKGYIIRKFDIMPVDTGGIVNGSNEATMQIYSVKDSATTQSALANASVDFSNTTLLGVSYFLRDQAVVAITSETVIFDRTVFNQDIFVVYKDSQTNTVGMNYHIELEQIKLDSNETAVATLKNIKNR